MFHCIFIEKYCLPYLVDLVFLNQKYSSRGQTVLYLASSVEAAIGLANVFPLDVGMQRDSHTVNNTYDVLTLYLCYCNTMLMIISNLM